MMTVSQGLLAQASWGRAPADEPYHCSSGHRQPFILCQVVCQVGQQHTPGQAAEQPLYEDEEVGGHPQQGDGLVEGYALAVNKIRVCSKLCLHADV